MEEKVFKSNRLTENSVRDNYIQALKDPEFKSLIARLKIDEKEAMKNTTKLQDTVAELKRCKECPGLVACQNKEVGCVNYPQIYHDHLIFSYTACKFKKEQIKKEESKKTATKELDLASMKNIDINDQKRVKLIKWVTKFINSYDSTKINKGLYLHGNFGCGKTYILAAMFNELKKEKYSTEIVYFPTLLRELKSDFDQMNDVINHLCNVDLLLIDDIGAEKVTEWSRDEILGTVLQERMNNYKTTFFTSNFNIQELEKHLANDGDIVKARRIVERIKQLSDDLEMNSENRRK